jgi:hypothetical protein
MMLVAEPDKEEPDLRQMRHYARGEAFAVRGDAAGVAREAAALGQGGLERMVLEGRAAMLRGDGRAAVAAFERAARTQERFYGGDMDPPPWWYPVRRSLAAAKLKAGDAKGAAAEARKVLRGWPKEPLTLIVLSQAETALGHAEAAAARRAEAQAGWSGDLRAVKLETI